MSIYCLIIVLFIDILVNVANSWIRSKLCMYYHLHVHICSNYKIQFFFKQLCKCKSCRHFLKIFIRIFGAHAHMQHFYKKAVFLGHFQNTFLSDIMFFIYVSFLKLKLKHNWDFFGKISSPLSKFVVRKQIVEIKDHYFQDQMFCSLWTYLQNQIACFLILLPFSLYFFFGFSAVNKI